LYSSPNINNIELKIRWMGHVECVWGGSGGSIYVYIVWLEKNEGTVSLRITRHRLG